MSDLGEVTIWVRVGAQITLAASLSFYSITMLRFIRNRWPSRSRDELQCGRWIMTPRIAYLDDPQKLWYGGGEIDWRRTSAFTPGFNQSAQAKLAMTERDVTFASGCALFVRASVLGSWEVSTPGFSCTKRIWSSA